MFTKVISTSRSKIQFEQKTKSVLEDSPKGPPKPWMVASYSPEREQEIYVSWGKHCAFQQQMQLAESYFNRALEIKPRNAKALYSRSICKRNLSEPLQAFNDSLKASYLEPFKSPINQELCNTLYELNEFEAGLVETYRIMQSCDGPDRKRFAEFFDVIRENMSEILGNSAGFFFIQHEKICNEVLQEFKRKNSIDKRPLWKILNEQKNCDVLSIPERKELNISPLEMARRARLLKVFYQRYLGRSWFDVLTLKNLPEHEMLVPKYYKESTPKLRDLLTTQNKGIKKFALMLHVRNPMYCGLSEIMKRKKFWDKCHDSYINMLRLRTRRELFLALRTIRELRKSGSIEKLRKYVERIMGDYIVVKTYSICPRKFEFMHDVYSLMALAYADLIVVPQDFDRSSPDALDKLFKLPQPTERVLNGVVQKDKTCFQSKQKQDNSMTVLKSFLKRMDKRLHFAEHPIERAYLFYEIARTQFKANYMNDSAAAATRGVKAALACNHLLYGYLCTLEVARAHASNFKIEQSLSQLKKALKLANRLKNQNLINYTNIIKRLVEVKIETITNQPSFIEKKNKFRLIFNNSSTTTNVGNV